MGDFLIYVPASCQLQINAKQADIALQPKLGIEYSIEKLLNTNFEQEIAAQLNFYH